MKNEKRKKKEKEWRFIEELNRCFKICLMVNYISKNRECIVSEIKNKFGFSKSTLYDYIERAAESELIIKESNIQGNKNGAHYKIIALPRLHTIVRQFNRQILKFLQNTPDDLDIFDKKSYQFLETK